MYSSRRDSVKRHINIVHDGTGVIVSFIDYLVGRFSGVYVPGVRPTYMKKKSATTTVDYVDTFRQELVRGLAERTINNYFNPPSQQQKSGSNNSGHQSGATTGMGGGYYYGKPDEVFGYRAVLCDKCLWTDALEVYFTANDDPKVGRTERRHTCNPQWVAANESELTAEKRQESVKRMLEGLPSYLANVASVWTAGKPGLIALKLTNPAVSSIKVRHPAATELDNKTITLQQSYEGIIEVKTLDDIDGYHWVARAIREGQTGLSEKELEEFCRNVQSKTFGFFKIGGVKEEPPSVYLMAITNLQWKKPAENKDQVTDSKTMI
jgi:hypothetical protein